MHCGDVETRLDAFIDSELTPSEQVDVARHLAACRPCEERVRDMLGLRDVLTATATEAADDLNLARIWPAVESAMDEHDARRWWPWSRVGRVAHGLPMWAAGVAVAAGALLTMRAIGPTEGGAIVDLPDPPVLIDHVAGRDIALRHDAKHGNTVIFVSHQVEGSRR